MDWFNVVVPLEFFAASCIVSYPLNYSFFKSKLDKVYMGKFLNSVKSCNKEEVVNYINEKTSLKYEKILKTKNNKKLEKFKEKNKQFFNTDNFTTYPLNETEKFVVVKQKLVKEENKTKNDVNENIL